MPATAKPIGPVTATQKDEAAIVAGKNVVDNAPIIAESFVTPKRKAVIDPTAPDITAPHFRKDAIVETVSLSTLERETKILLSPFKSSVICGASCSPIFVFKVVKLLDTLCASLARVSNAFAASSFSAVAFFVSSAAVFSASPTSAEFFARTGRTFKISSPFNPKAARAAVVSPPCLCISPSPSIKD